MLKDQSRSEFVVVVHGQIEQAYFPSIPNICVHYTFSLGPDWSIVAGPNEGLSACCSRGTSNKIVVALPFEVTFSSTNPYKWPQMVLSCYGSDAFGNDVIRGYGALPLPTVPGSHSRRVPCFVPEASSLFQKAMGILWGRRAEFADAKIVALPDGRHATRVSTKGELYIRISTIIKDIKKFGFDVTQIGLATPSDTQFPDYNTKSQMAELQKKTEKKVKTNDIITEDDEVKTSDEKLSSKEEEQDIRPLPQLIDDI